QPYRLNPKQLRKPVAVGFLKGASLFHNGFGLIDVLDRMPFRVYGELLELYCQRVPHVEEVLREHHQQTQGEKEVRFKLKNGAEIPARQASDGAMLILGFLALVMDKEAPQLILIEEPENGIHPA